MYPPSWSTMFCNLKTIFSTADRREFDRITRIRHQSLVHMLSFEGRYCLPGNPRTKSRKKWHLEKAEPILLENDNWSAMHLWNAVLAIPLPGDQCEEVPHPAWNDIIKASTLLKLRHNEIYQHIMVPLSCDETADQFCPDRSPILSVNWRLLEYIDTFVFLASQVELSGVY